MKKKYDKIIHISDTDMDGYGAQYMMSKTNPKDITYYNPKRNELGEIFNKVFKEILKNKDKKILLLITDFSLEEQWVKKLNNFKKGNKHIQVEYQLLDHHATGEKISKENDWYHFDNYKCSALLTAKYVVKYFLNDNEEELKNELLFIGELIDKYDRWITEDELSFEQSNYLNQILFESSRIPDVLKEKEKLKRNKIFELIDKIGISFKNENSSIEDIEMKKPKMEKDYLKGKIETEMLENKNISIFKKYCKYYANEYLKDEKKYKTIYIDNIPFKVFYNVTGEVWQQMSSYVLNNAKEAKALISIGQNGRCSLRTRNPEVNVRIIAEKYLNGGGHDQAAGGSIEEILEANSIEEILKIVEKKFQKTNKKKQINKM